MEYFLKVIFSDSSLFTMGNFKDSPLLSQAVSASSIIKSVSLILFEDHRIRVSSFLQVIVASFLLKVIISTSSLLKIIISPSSFLKVIISASSY